MGASARPQTIEEALAEIRAQKQEPVAPAKDINAALNEIRAQPDTAQGMSDLLHETGVMGGEPQKPKPPAVQPDVSRALARNRPNPTGDIQATALPAARSLTANALSAAQAVPGVEAAEAGLMTLGSKAPWSTPMTYRESLATLRNQTNQINPLVRIAGQAAFGGRYLPLKTLSPAKTGAVLGGAHEALSADPDVGPGGRALRAAAGAAAGGTAGKFLDMVTTGTRAALAKNPAKNILERQAARAKSAAELHTAAIAEGHENEATPIVKSFLEEEDVAPRVKAILKLDQFKGMDPTDPEVLIALSKSFTDEAHGYQKGLQMLDPTNPNTRQMALQNVKSKQKRFMSALSTPDEGLPAMMPKYPEAKADYARQSREIEAVGKGMTASQGAARPTTPTYKQVISPEPKTPETFEQYLNAPGRTLGEREAASQGILGDVSNAFKLPGKTLAPFRQRASQGASLLRKTQTPEQELVDLFQRYGLLGAASKSNP